MSSTREFTVHDVARQLNVSEPSLRYAIAAGQLPVIRRLGRIYVTPDGIEAFVRRRSS